LGYSRTFPDVRFSLNYVRFTPEIGQAQELVARGIQSCGKACRIVGRQVLTRFVTLARQRSTGKRAND
jgi:hypothetical protein